MHERFAELRPSSATAGLDSDVLDRLAAAGFNAILAGGSSGSLPSSLSADCSACAGRGMRFWLVVTPDQDGMPRFSPHAGPATAPWLIADDAALDPRRPPGARRLPAVDPDDAATAAWRAAVDAAAAAGVAGFVCREPDRLPAAWWAALLSGSRGLPNGFGWIAWTPGLAPDVITALLGAGFERCCCSLGWWNGRSGWLVEELCRHPGVDWLGFPLDPFAVRPSTDDARVVEWRTLVGAAIADALLVPQSVWDRPGDGIPTFVVAANRCLAANALRTGRATVIGLSAPDALVTTIARIDAPDLRAAQHVRVLCLNAGPDSTATLAAATMTSALAGFGDYRTTGCDDGGADRLDTCSTIALAAGEVQVFEAERLPAIELPTAQGKPRDRRLVEQAMGAARIAIEAVTPTVDGGRHPVKRTAGEAVRIEADILIDGHEQLAAVVLHRPVGERAWTETRMEAIGNDRYAASIPLLRVGRHEFTIEAWHDIFATYRHELDKKFTAGLDVSLELAEGRALVARAIRHAESVRRPRLAKRLSALADAIGGNQSAKPGKRRPATEVSHPDPATMASQVAQLLGSQTTEDLRAADPRDFATRPVAPFTIDAERSGASFASWYELFPRSQGNRPGQALRHGTFDDVIERLPAVRAMGFDVLYFPPIQPIGKKNRKGKNNSLTPSATDPGSPYAIGSEDGGHDAIHPELGSFEDFRRLRDAALEQGLELALDFAIQCSPDHPWLKQYPGWFAWRPDGSIRYAENPPKKYEDIVNVDFYGNTNEAPALWQALRDVVLAWAGQGVRLFRVDNPHTKPLPFWEWMINEVRATYPDTIFLAEAFTRPKLMYRLAKIGFSQSYTYFTWRDTKAEFIDYMTELTAPSSTSAPRDFFRPHFFVNTPDINPVFLQRSGRPGFLIRAALAATLSGLWGVYSGFELCEATPVPGKEEYLDSEKYEIRAWDWQRPGNIVDEITTLNRIRRENPAFRTHLNLRFQNVFDPNLLYFMKATEDRSNIVLVAINLDPHGIHEADFELPLWEWKLPDDASVGVTDLLSGERFRWQGKRQRMRLEPMKNPYAIWRIAP